MPYIDRFDKRLNTYAPDGTFFTGGPLSLERGVVVKLLNDLAQGVSLETAAAKFPHGEGILEIYALGKGDNTTKPYEDFAGLIDGAIEAGKR